MSEEKEIIEVDIQVQVRVGDSARGREWVEGLVEDIIRFVGKKHLKRGPRVSRQGVKKEPVQ